MKKRVLAMLLCACILFGMLSGCVPKDTGSGEQLSTKPSQTEPNPTVPGPTESTGGEEVTPPTDDTQTPDVPEETEDGEAEDVPDSSGSGNSSGSAGAKTYQVSFVTNGGDPIYARYVKKGTSISSLPTPFRAGYTFTGWCYDKELTSPVGRKDTIQGKTSLYAKYEEQALATQVIGESFTSSLKETTSFEITILSSDPSLTAQQVQALLEAKNLSAPEESNFITVTGENGVYTLKGVNGFNPGSTYRINLEDGRLAFQGHEAAVREYNFTTDMPQVMNLQLVDGILYIPIEQLSNITSNGEQVDNIQTPMYVIDETGTMTPGAMVSGQFTYHGVQALQVGDDVVIYEGLRPDLRNENSSDEDNGEVAYVEITAVNGNVYSYTSAKAADMIMRPDLLPVDMENDIDTNDTTVTLDNKYLDYSDDIYANIRLDANTTVDVGDFVMFYTGQFGLQGSQVLGYGRITVVTVGETVTVITYETCDWETVQKTMDVRSEQSISGKELLKDVDVEQVEAAIVQQALESGFADEVAMFLVSTATATNNFEKLPDGLEMTDIKIVLEDGTQVSPEQLQLMAGGVEAKVKMSKIAANISTDLKHFDGFSGVRFTLEVGADITFTKEDNQVVLTVLGTFEQENYLALDVTAQAMWNNWGAFPYIEDFRMVAAIDVYDYTGLSFDLILGTKEKKPNGEWTGDEDFDKDIQRIKTALKLKKMLTASDVNVADSLVDKYTKMIKKETDSLTLVDKQIFRVALNVPFGLPIFIVELKASFVVSLDASAALGLDFYYMNADRHVFVLDVYSGKLYNDTIKIQEKTFELTAYAMGRLTVRMGVRLEFNIGFIDTERASVGLFAEAGAYLKMFGYFYYSMHKAESTGKKHSFNGAMYIELGGYLEIGGETKLLKELISAEVLMVDEQYPWLSAGQRMNVLDFRTGQENMPFVRLKNQKTVQLGDDLFMMNYLDLLEGGQGAAIYDDSEDFSITFDNPAFSYQADGNFIIVKPGEGVRELDGTMTITWKGAPLAFSSNAITRTIPIHWDDLRDAGYVITPYTNGGSYVTTYCQAYNTDVVAPADPVKTGYVFAGWYADEALTVPYTFPEKMPAEDANIYAAWAPATDTVYTVEHYKQILGSSVYELVETQTFTGETDSIANTQPLTYTGFHTPAKQNVVIKPDGSAIVNYFYDRIVSTVTFDGGAVSDLNKTYQLQYGATVCPPQPAVAGYDFIGWDKEVEPVMGATSVTYTAQWKKSDVDFRVEYYVQQPDGRYTLQEQVVLRKEVGTELTKKYLLEELKLASGKTAAEQYSVPNGIVFEAITENGIDMTASGKNATAEAGAVIKVRFARMKHTATFNPANGADPIVISLYSGAALTAPKGLTRTGYAFAGWDRTVPATIGTENLTFTAQWQKNNYAVRFNPEGGNGTMNVQGLVYDTKATLNPNAFTRPGYAFAGWTTHKGTPVELADGAEVMNLATTGVVELYAVWTPVDYTISYVLNGGTNGNNPATYTIEQTVHLAAPSRTGYTFAGWQNAEGKDITEIAAGTTGNLVLKAVWTANQDTDYKVEHYLETLEGGYELAQRQELEGTTDASVTPDTQAFEGFTAPAKQTVSVKADGSLVVKYYYTRNQYTLTFSYEDGMTESTQVTVPYGAQVNLPKPSREGYGFGGWMKADGSAYTDQKMGAQSITLYAKWNANEYGYTIHYYLQNVSGEGYTLDSTVHSSAKMDAVLTVTAKDIVGFTKPDGQKLTITANADDNVVDFYYTRNQYTLAFDANGGVGGNAGKQVYYGAAIAAPAVTKEGYSFAGWNQNVPITMPAKDMTFVATWTANKYTISFYRENNILLGKVTAEYGTTIPAREEPGRTGYTFAGWDQEVHKTMPAKDMAITAKWTPIIYTITYELAGGVNHPDNPKGYTIEDAFRLQAPTRTGYTFSRWVDQHGNGVTAISKNTIGEMTLTAKWSANTYQVMFHANNGTGDSFTQDFAYDESKALAKNTFNKTGYSFAGWALTADGAKTYEDEEKVSNLAAVEGTILHLYATWTPNTYKITYVFDYGVQYVPTKNPTSYVMDSTIHLQDPELQLRGMHFMGWYSDPDYQKKIDGEMKVSVAGGLQIYGKLEYNTYFINYYAFRKDTTVPDGQQVLEWGPSDFKDPLLNVVNTTDLSVKLRFQNPGYDLVGWSLTQGGKKVLKVDATTGDLLQVLNGELPEGTDVVLAELYAVWQLKNYTIAFTGDEGVSKLPETMKFDVEDKEIVLPTPTLKPGYQFDGWFDENGNAIPGGKIVVAEGELEDKVIYTENLRDYKLTAKTSVMGYNISYDWNGGNPVAGAITTYNVVDGLSALPQPAYATYADYNYFLGWYDQSGKKYESIPAGTTGNLQLTAKWDLCTVYVVPQQTYTGGRVVVDLRDLKDTNLYNYIPFGTELYAGEVYDITYLADDDQIFEQFFIGMYGYSGNQNKLTIRFVDFNFNAGSYAAFSQGHNSEGMELTVDIEGTCIFCSQPNGGSVFGGGSNYIDNLVFTGDGYLSVWGSNGATTEGDGTSGNAAIKAWNVVVNMDGSLVAYGGNGANGANGGTDAKGGNGGNGGVGVEALTLLIQKGYVRFAGGKGGEAGHGGNGSNGRDAVLFGPSATDGNPGGAGGNGGNGAYAVRCGDVVISTTARVYLYGGDGGHGGTGGNGGNGGDSIFSSTSGGAGGAGGAGGVGASALPYVPSFGNNVTIVSGSNKIGGSSGSAGSGG